MKVVELLKIGGELLKLMSRHDVLRDDWRFVPMYEEFLNMRSACMVLSRRNNGYTFTDLEGQFTLMFASKADSPEELFDTYDHELKHAVEHISGFYGVHPKSETAAYLQGEIARNMFPAVAMAVCPKCYEK